MPWTNQGKDPPNGPNGGGGPWGGGDHGPWGGGSGGNGGRRPPGMTPPDFDRIMARLSEWFGKLFPPGRGRYFVGIAVVVLAWLASGIYRVQPDEQGVVLRFGAYNRTTLPGLHYHLPQPIEAVLTPKVTRVNRTDVGIANDSNGASVDVQQESLMLTGDENIVDVNLSVFWVIDNAKAYLFNIRNPELTVKSATESALREVIGRTPIAAALAQGRTQIETDTRSLLQSILDRYGAGVKVTEVQLLRADPPQPVIEAFRDVQRARTDSERLQNEAQAYSNDILPRARGDAQKIIQEANGYKQQVLAQAQGEGQRFLEVYNAWKSAKDITSERLYLDTMSKILAHAHKIVLDHSAASNGVLPYLPLQPNGAPSIRGQAPPRITPPAASTRQTGDAQ
ncbi:MAG TPA: FtsH protease activity modulator HflK [Stellaceae bacterium]|jgi:membrane protease subunit HflK|nr:FtsH protease activity modulator HflK [Stellaceae bacterium]